MDFICLNFQKIWFHLFKLKLQKIWFYWFDLFKLKLQSAKNKTAVKLTAVSCAPVVEVKIKRPDTKYQLGFSVQNGVVRLLTLLFKMFNFYYLGNVRLNFSHNRNIRHVVSQNLARYMKEARGLSIFYNVVRPNLSLRRRSTESVFKASFCC